MIGMRHYFAGVDVRYALSAHLTAPKLRPKHLNCAQDWERQKDRKTQICA